MVAGETAVVLVAARTTTLVFGGVLTYLSFKAYRRMGSPALRALGVGIGLLIAGATLGGLLHQVVGLGLELSVSVQSIFTAVGFAVMTYSLFTDVSSSTGGAGRVPRGRTEIGDFRDDETLRVSNHLTPRVKAVRSVKRVPFAQFTAQSCRSKRRLPSPRSTIPPKTRHPTGIPLKTARVVPTSPVP